jgi:hypothetical protein
LAGEALQIAPEIKGGLRAFLSSGNVEALPHLSTHVYTHTLAHQEKFADKLGGSIVMCAH